MQSNYILKGLFLVLLFSNYTFSNTFSNNIINLSNDKYWHTLIHYKNGSSQIESKEFFLSANGKNNSYLELNTTINNLINPLHKDDNSTYCRFPARRLWIINMLPKIKIKKQTCKLLEKELEEIKDIEKVTLIFPTTHINSPASMFGHTLLRLDDKNGDLLNSYAINYAAFTNESNGILYAWNGLTGGYKGKYSIVPYFKKINEYNNMENRDIWEYELNLNKNEIYKLKLHLYEIKHSWSKYYYFNKNCSYEILWLLQSARDTLDLTSKFNFKTLPIDTIKEIKENNLVKKTVYRANARKKLMTVYNNINNKELALKYYKTTNISLLKNENINQKRNIANFSLEYLKYNKTQNIITRDIYLKKLLDILKFRSTLGQEKALTIKKDIDPTKIHSTNKISIEVNKNNIDIELKPSFHSLDDLNNGFINGAYIDFFKININKKNNEDISLNNFSLFDIKSYAPRNDLFKPISWAVDVGYEKFKDNNYFKLKLETGVTYEYKNFLNSYLVLVNLYTKKHSYLGYGFKYYFEYNFQNSKVGLDARYEIYDYDKYKIYNMYYIQKLTNDINIKIGLKKDFNDSNKYLSLSYNF